MSSSFDELWQISLDVNKKQSHNSLSEVAYFFLKDSDSDKFSIEPMQIVYATTYFGAFVPKLVHVSNNIPTIIFNEGIERAIEAFELASIKEDSIHFKDYFFFRPLNVSHMTLALKNVNGLFSGENTYRDNLVSISKIYENDFESELKNNNHLMRNVNFDVFSWHKNNNNSLLGKNLYYPHFEKTKNSGLVEFKNAF